MSPIIRPRHDEDAYPIGRLVLDRSKSLGLSRTDLVRRLGFDNLNAGHRALIALLTTGSASPIIAAKLAEALEIEPDMVEGVLAATARQQHDEARARASERERAYRAAFRPHLQVETEREIPSPIFVAALLTTARLRMISLPHETFSAGDDARDRIVKAMILAHYRDQAGCVPAFGAITGYVLVIIAGYGRDDFGLPFDVNGEPAGPMCEVRRLPEATLGTKRGDTRLTGLLKDAPIQAIR